MKHAGRLALVWLVLLVLPLPLVVILDSQLVDTPTHLFAYDLGLFAYVWWLSITFLATRPRWLTQWVGMPSLYLIHGLLGIFALVAATCHKFLSFSMFPQIKLAGNIAWGLEIFLLVYAVLFLSGWLVDRSEAFAHLKHLAERHGLPHQVTMLIHRLNWVVVFLIWLHVQLIVRVHVGVFMPLFDAYTVLAVFFYVIWKIRQTHGIVHGRVIRNRTLSDHSSAITVQLVDSQIDYRAGDFYFLTFQGFSHEPHPFSVASVPKQHQSTINFIIHHVGDFTQQLTQLKKGTAVKLEGPFGQFDQLVANSHGPVLLYGLGTGVAPLLSLAKKYAPVKHLHLLWSGPQVHDRFYQDQLHQLESRGIVVDNQLHRFTDDQLAKIIDGNEIEKGQVIIIGSANKVLQVRKMLKHCGFKKSQLHDERMTL